MANLTESMIARIFPTMKLQIEFMQCLEKLKEPSQPLINNYSTEELANGPSTSTAVSSVPLSSKSTYILPKFPPDVNHQLLPEFAAKFGVGSKLRNMIIDAIHIDLLSSRLLYPSRLDYDKICSAITLRYPFLADYDGSSNSWRACLRCKYKRTRQPLLQEGQVEEMRAKFGRPGVSGRKRKHQEEVNEVADESPKALRYQVRMVDSLLIGEDQKTIAKHVANQKLEMKKRDPDKKILKDIFMRTAAYRQKFSHEHSTLDVLEEFPAYRLKLFLTADVKLLYDMDVTTIGPRLLAVFDRILKEAATRCKRYNEFIDNYKASTEGDLSPTDVEDFKIALCIMLLPSLFSENEKYICVAKQEDVLAPTPIIVGQHTFDIKLDACTATNEKLTRFRDAVEVWFSTFWIFSIQYPSKLSNTCLFIEKILLGKQGKVPAKVRKWANRLVA